MSVTAGSTEEIDYGMLDTRFQFHPADEDRGTCHEAVRTAARTMAVRVLQVAPDSRERALALTKIEEAMMWANAAIAREGN